MSVLGEGGMRGSVVLVHGKWGHPEDWRWVSDHLRSQGVLVRTPDLPSHSSPTDGLSADAAAVAEVLHASTPPVVAVGWSYGGDVLGDAAADQHSVVRRLVYVARVPRVAGATGTWIIDDAATIPHLDIRDATFVLDDAWWLTEEDGATLPADVQQHLWKHRRRPVSFLAETEPQRATSWQTIPTTVLLGRSDPLISEADREWVAAHVQDVRLLDTDHFILWREPEAVADAILEALAAAQGA